MGKRMWDDPALLAAMREALRTGEKGESVARRFGVNGTTAARARIYAEGQLSVEGAHSRPGKPARDINLETNSTRQRRLKSLRRGDNYAVLLMVQLRISELCAALESVRMEDYGLDEVSLWRISDIEDDLINLTSWVDRTLGQVTGRLGDEEIRKKIRIMRDTTGRTVEEAASMAAVADKLERKLRNRLEARSQ